MKKGQKKRVWTPEQKLEIVHKHLDEHISVIKPTNYEAQKTKKFKAQIGRIENMQYDKAEDCFTCAEGRKLYCRKVSTEVKDGIPVTRAWYRCESCVNCPQREKCCRKQAKNPLF